MAVAGLVGGTYYLSLKPAPSPPIMQLHLLLKKFKNAYEKEDLQALQTISTMTPERLRNVEFMFANYQSVKVSIEEVVVSDEEASALMILNELIQNNGEHVKLSKIGSTIKLKIGSVGTEWGKIAW